MTFQEAIRVCFNKYADFTGTASREEYWWFFLFLVLGSLLAIALNTGLAMAFSLATILPSLAAATRRLHDTGRSGWWLLISLVPLLGHRAARAAGTRGHLGRPGGGMMQLYSHNQAQAHRQPTRHWSRLLMAASLAIAASSAAWAADLTPAQRAAFAAEMAQVRAFMLTDRFIDKYLAAAADPDYPVAALDGMIVGTDDDDDDADEGDEDDYSADDDADEYSAEEGDEDEEEPSQSLAQMIGEIEAVPGATDFLARHGLSVRDFVLGRGMMTYAAILHAQQQDPGLFEDDEDDEEDYDLSLVVSSANLAVYVRNKDKMHRTMMAVGERRLRSLEKTPEE